jgi:hypothetical protein
MAGKVNWGARLWPTGVPFRALAMYVFLFSEKAGKVIVGRVEPQ